uniref:Uncharacterized protein n=1 Tax=Arundo donax TaxID=35708 RepID=A0A0A9GFW5_ARUDO
MGQLSVEQLLLVSSAPQKSMKSEFRTLSAYVQMS